MGSYHREVHALMGEMGIIEPLAIETDDAEPRARTVRVFAIAAGRLLIGSAILGDVAPGKSRWVIEAFPLSRLKRIQLDETHGSISVDADEGDGNIMMFVPRDVARALLVAK